MKLVMHPSLGLCLLISGDIFLDYATALERYPKETACLMEKGEIDNSWRPKPENAVCDEEGIAKTTISDFLPEGCDGETYAITEEPLHRNMHFSDFDCIEGNWEQRGDYYIIDVRPRNIRLAHSDKHNYTAEFPITSE